MIRSTKVAVTALGLTAAGLGLVGCSRSEASTAPDAPPAVLEAVPGSDVQKVTFTDEASEAVGVETAPVSRGAGGSLTVPYSAVIYYLDGTTWVYTQTDKNAFLRVPITVGGIKGEVATLTAGPAVGTPVVTVGAPEVLGAELEIDGEQ